MGRATTPLPSILPSALLFRLLLLLLLLLVLPSAFLLPAVSAQSDVEVSISVLFTTDDGANLAMDDQYSAYLLLAPDTTFTGTTTPSPAAVVSAMSNGQSDFALLSTGLTSAQALAYPDLAMFPAMVYALVPIYRLDALGAAAPQLVLDRQTLASIYLGLITWWNDSAIQATNPEVTLPQQHIVMVLPPAGLASTGVWSTALSKFLPAFASTVGTSMVPPWPTGAYSASVTGNSATSQAAAVVATDGSVGFAIHSIALALQCSIAALINTAGNTVTASVSSVTFAAVELGTAARARTTQSMDLTDASGSSSWPITMLSFLLIDLQNSRATCHVRAAVVEFWLSWYTGALATRLMAARQYAPVPDIVLTQLEVVNTLTQNTMCRGNVAYPAQLTTTRIIGAPLSVSFLSSLFADLYATVDDSVVWQVQTNTDQLILQQVANAEVDIGFVNPNNVDPTLWQAFLQDTTFLTLPTYLFAVGAAYNPQITATVNIAGNTLSLSMQTVGLILYQCVIHWNDPAILAQNPWLAPLLPLLSDTPVPIYLVLGCSDTGNGSPLEDALLTAVAEYQASSGDHVLAACMHDYPAVLAAAHSACESVPGETILFTASESTIPSLVAGTTGSLGVMQATGSDAYGWVTITDLRDGVWANTTATIADMAACALDTLDLAAFNQPGNPLLLSPGSSNPNCYRATQQVVVITRATYSSAATDASSCTHGFDSLSFLQWFYTTPDIDVLTNSVDEARVSTLSADALAVSLQVINSATCDGQTMLITPPLEWSLSGAVFAFVTVMSSVGLLACVAMGGFVFAYRAHPMIRSASPLFLLLSISGVALLFSAGYPLVATVTVASCTTFSWLVNIGLMLTFAPLFAKTWRIYRIFGRKKLSVVVISNKRLLAMVGCFLLVEVAVMGVWQGIGNLQPVVNEVQTSSTVSSTVAAIAARLVVDEYVQCGVPDGGAKSMFVLVCVEKALLFAWGAVTAFTTRKVSSTFNEAAGISIAIYNVCFTIGIIAPIILVIGAVGDPLNILLAFALLWIAFFTSGVLFGPKVMVITAGTKEQINPSLIASSGNSSSGYQFLSLAAMSTTAVLQGYLSALEKHLEQVRDKLAKLKKRQSAMSGAADRPHSLPWQNSFIQPHAHTATSSPPAVLRSSQSLGDTPVVKLRRVAEAIGKATPLPPQEGSRTRQGSGEHVSRVSTSERDWVEPTPGTVPDDS